MKELLTLTRRSETILGIEFLGNNDYENFFPEDQHSLEFDAQIDGDKVFIEFDDEMKSAHRKAIREGIAEKYGKNMVVVFEDYDPDSYKG